MKYTEKILITGGTGMVGKHLEELMFEAAYDQLGNADRLTRKIPNIKFIGSLDYDLRDWNAVDRLFNDFRPERVIHLAAKVGGIQANINSPADFYEDNVLMNTNLLKASKKYDVKRFTGMLSTCIYPNTVLKYPMTEDDLFVGPPAETNHAYAYAKRVMAVHINAYNTQHKTKYNYLISPNLYSEHDNFEHGEKMHFITALLKKIREADISKKKTIQLLGTGKPLRQFMYAKDLALAILTMIQNDITDSFNVAPKFNYSIDDMAKMSIKSLGKKLTVNYPSKSLDGQYRKDVSSAKMLKLMPNFKFTGFKQGITKVYNAILEKENNE